MEAISKERYLNKKMEDEMKQSFCRATYSGVDKKTESTVLLGIRQGLP